MTSNLGSEHILEGHPDLVMKEVEAHFRPEFINRIDEVITFKKLSRETTYEILDKIILEIESRLRDKNIHLTLTDQARDYLIEHGYSEVYGARPLKRLVTKKIEDLLARSIIQDEIHYGMTVEF